MTDHEPLHVYRGQGEEHTFLGLAHRILADGQQSAGRFSIVELTVEPGAGVPQHSSTESFGWYVLEGSLTFQTRDGIVELSEGDFSLHPPGFQQAFANQGNDRTRVLLIFSPPGAEGFFVEAGKAFPSEVPNGPPPAEAVQALRELGARYGMQLHV